MVLICIDGIASQCAKLKGRCIKRSEDGIITERRSDHTDNSKPRRTDYLLHLFATYLRNCLHLFAVLFHFKGLNLVAFFFFLFVYIWKEHFEQEKERAEFRLCFMIRNLTNLTKMVLRALSRSARHRLLVLAFLRLLSLQKILKMRNVIFAEILNLRKVKNTKIFKSRKVIFQKARKIRVCITAYLILPYELLSLA